MTTTAFVWDWLLLSFALIGAGAVLLVALTEWREARQRRRASTRALAYLNAMDRRRRALNDEYHGRNR